MTHIHDDRELLALAEKLNVSYLVTLNKGGVTEKNLSADELDTILFALRSAALPMQAEASREEIIETGVVHKLKTWPRYFADILSGVKPFEWRIEDDRSFTVGDTLILQEWEPARENLGCKEGRYTGREIKKIISYCFNPFATNKRTVVMGFASKSADDGVREETIRECARKVTNYLGATTESKQFGDETSRMLLAALQQHPTSGNAR